MEQPRPPGSSSTGEAIGSSSSTEDDDAFVPESLAANQLKALLWKNYKVKQRNVCSTFCELCSPCLLIAVLVWGFSLRTITVIAAENYAVVNRTIPGPLLRSALGLPLADTASGPSRPSTQLFDLLKGPLPVPTLDQYVTLSGLASSAIGELRSSPLLNSDEGQGLTNLLFLGSLHFAPASPATQSLLSHLSRTSSSFANLTTSTHVDEDSALQAMMAQEGRAWALVLLHRVEPGNVDVTLRMNYSAVPSTYDLVDWMSVGLDTEYQDYYLSGFLTLQAAVNEWAYNYTTTTTSSSSINGGGSGGDANEGRRRCSGGPPRVLSAPMPTSAFSSNTFFAAVGYLLGLALTMATLYPVSKLLKDIVEEKETRMKETLKIMGCKGWVLSLSWLLQALSTFSTLALGLTWLMSTSFLPQSDPSLLFAYLMLFFLSEIAFVFLLSTLFSRAKLAAIVGPVALFVTVLPRYIFFNTASNEASMSKYAASLLSATAFTFGADVLSGYEGANVGVQWGNSRGRDTGAYSFASCLHMMLLDTVLYLLLACYLDKVVPSEYGTHEKPWFFLLPSYWHRPPQPDSQSHSPTEDMMEAESVEGPPDPTSHPRRVSVRGLVKRYGDGNVAVKGLGLDMFEGHVTCLLGHNGAGKTSAISLLTGLFPPTSGDATIWGHSLTRDLPRIRQSLGICPQLNVLFPEMTVAEHLTFFSLLKGMPTKLRAKRVDNMIREVGLWEKRHTYSRALSGGMKRKLCIANALVASPNFILLDEPTSGMDPFSRRATWELIQRSKRKRVVVLTTHYLDEAELLGDRIAIMSAGVLKTCGTPLFLKHRYGSGYSLTLVTSSPSPASAGSLSSLVHHYAPDAELFSEAGAELLFRLPLSCSAVFPALLRALGGEEGRSLGIQSFGISMTTLEEVFLRIAKDEHARQERHQQQQQQEQQQPQSPPHQAVTLDPVFEQTGGSAFPFPLDASAHSPLHNTLTLRGRDTTIQAPPFPTAAGSAQAQVCDLELPPLHQTMPLDGPPSSSRPSTCGPCPPSHPWALEGERLWEQLRQLLWKRAIVARRDVKGLCFQVLLPALVIALVLLILTIKPRMAGPSIPLDLGLYARYGSSETLYSSPEGNASSPSFSLLKLSPQEDASRSTAYSYVDSGSSYNTSDLLLQHYYDHGSEARLGALVLDDQVLLNLTIDFPVLQGSLPKVEETILPLAEASVFEGLTSPAPGVIAYQGPVAIPFSTQDSSAQALLTSAVQAVNGNADVSVTSPEAVGSLVDGLLQTLNLTDSEALQALNVPVPANVTLTDLLLELLNPANTSTPLSGSLLVQRLLLNTTSDELTLQDTELQTNTGGSIMLGNLTYVLDGGSLPDEPLLFQFFVASPYTILHNTSSPHAVAAYYGELVRLEYERCSGQPSPHFVTRSHPLPLTESETLNVQTVLSLFTALFLLIPLTYIPAAFVVFVVRERAVKSKHLQFVSGVNRQMYWVSTFVWDMLQYAVLCCLIMGVLFLYGGGATRTYLYTTETTLATFLLLWFYGLAAIVQAYLYSWGFENAATAQISIMGINFLTGFVFVMAYYIMLSIPKTEAAAVQIVKFFRLFPSFNIGDGLINLSTMYYMDYWFEAELSAFDWDCTGRPLAYLVAELVVFGFLVLAVDSDVCERGLEVLGRAQDRLLLGKSEAQADEGQEEEEDEDVAGERQRVRAARGGDSEHAVLLQGLRKTYRQAQLSQCFARGGQEGPGGRTYKRAVRGVTLAIPHAQCFGFLGINGAGKTTTLSIVTGDLRETAGACFVNGHPPRSAEARRSIGYCPQVDPLTDFMTGMETLLFYGSLKGLAKDKIPHAAQSLIQRVGLQKFAHKPCGSYSGGNKRKLSLAIALIGDPPVVLLDEPSCGMDPEARRQMWDVITACSKHQSIILTTHSMEECEALCSRVSIMVGGRLRCLGSCQHLKNRFGRGYKVEVRCTSTQHLPTLAGALTDCFGPGVREEETHGLLVRYSLLPTVPPLPTDILSPPSPAIQGQEWLADLFSLLELAKERGQVDEYCVSQTTLEQVFVQFAKAQEDEEDAESHPNAASTQKGEKNTAPLPPMTGPITRAEGGAFEGLV